MQCSEKRYKPDCTVITQWHYKLLSYVNKVYLVPFHIEISSTKFNKTQHVLN